MSIYPRTNAVSFCWEIEDSFHGTVKTLFKCSLYLVEIRAQRSEISSRAGRLCHSALGQGVTPRPLSLFLGYKPELLTCLLVTEEEHHQELATIWTGMFSFSSILGPIFFFLIQGFIVGPKTSLKLLDQAHLQLTDIHLPLSLKS